MAAVWVFYDTVSANKNVNEALKAGWPIVIARLLDFPFWTEFWYEYAVENAFDWFIFQTWLMHNMGDSVLQSIWKGGRAEFFSMITVMLEWD